MQLKWYVLNIRPTWERKVSEGLSRHYIEHYCPFKTAETEHLPGQEPLFSACMFIRASLRQQDVLRTIPGILRFAYWLGRPATIRDDEMENIRKFLRENPAVTVKRLPAGFRPGQREIGLHPSPAKRRISRVILPSIGYIIVRKQNKPPKGTTS